MSAEDNAVPSAPDGSGDTATPPVQSDPAPEAAQTPKLDDIPEEYRGIVEEKLKSLQADYTKKTQDVADVRRKAEAFETLMADETAKTVLENLAKYGTPTPPQQAPVQKLTGEALLLGILEGGEEYLDRMIQERAERLIDLRVTPLSAAQAGQQAEAEMARLQAKYPDFMEREDEISRLIEESEYRLDPESAYKIAAFGKTPAKQAAEAAKAQSQEGREKAAGASPKGSPVATAPGRFKNISEAFEAAKRTHGR